MDYTRLTKKELVELLEQQEHLAAAVEVKDAEIIKLDKELRSAQSQLKNQEHLVSAVEAKDLEISKLRGGKAEEISKIKQEQDKLRASLQYENQELREKLAGVPDIDVLKESLKTVSEDNQKLVSFVNQYVQSFRNHLKMQQSSLENIIELEALISDQLNKKQER